MQDLIAQLVVEGVLDDSAAQRARAGIAEGKPLDEAVLAADGIPEEKLLRSLATIFDIPYIDLDKYELSKEFLAKFPTRLLVQHRLLPLEETDGVVTVATSNLCDTTGLDALRLACGRDCLCPSHLGPQGACEECVERTLAAQGLQRPKPPLPDISVDLPYQSYLSQHLNSAWYAGLAGGDKHAVKGPLPVTPPGLIHECRRLCSEREFRVDMLSYWLTSCPMIQARFRTCMVALEQWAFHYPEFRGEFLNLWMANADVIGMQADVTYFDRPDVRARHGAM